VEGPVVALRGDPAARMPAKAIYDLGSASVEEIARFNILSR